MAAKFLSFRDGGKTDEEGISKPFDGLFIGEVKAGFTTAQLSSPGMGVEVDEGSAFIDTGNGYPYHVWSDSAENVTIATADGSNPRWDLIVGYVDLNEVDDTDPNNPDAFKIVAVAGTPAGSPADPSAGAIQSAIGASNPYIILARVVVGAGVTTITNANIADRREMIRVAANTVDTDAIEDEAVTPDKWRNDVAFSAVKSATQSYSSGSGFVQLTFNTEQYDLSNNFASNAFTAPYNGIYTFTASAGYSPADGNRSIVLLYVNGTEARRFAMSAGTGGVSMNIVLDANIQLATNDVVTVYFWSSGNQTIVSDNAQTLFSGQLVSKT